MFINRISKSLALSLAAGTLAALSSSAAESATPAKEASASKPAIKAEELFADTVVAKGKGVEIKRNQLDEEVIKVKAQLAARGQQLPAEHRVMLEQGILDQLIQMQLLKAKATPEDKSAGKAAAEKQFAEAKAAAGSDEALNLRLKAQGLTREELLSKWTEVETAKATLSRVLKVDVTDADVKKFYDENPSKFEEPEMVRASHILFGVRGEDGKELTDEKKAAKRKEAEGVLKRARAGEDFAKLAKQYSEDPGSKDKGGEYTFPRGQMVKAFEDTAFSLKTNEISDLVTTQFGYHIIKLSEKLPAKKHELAEESSRIKNYLVQQNLQKAAPEYLEKLKKDAGVEILDEQLKPKEEVEPAPGLPAGHPAVQPKAKTASK